MEDPEVSLDGFSGFKVSFSSCPVKESLGVLGRKWALLIVRNIAIYRKQRFNEMLRFTPGLNRRVLSMRLAELREEGVIEPRTNDEEYTAWELTEKGKDVLPILMAILNYGVKWHADKVFPDKRSRSLSEIFDTDYIRDLLSAMVGTNL